MRVQFKVWSEVGHTPLTHRGGSFCDELVDCTRECRDMPDAHLALAILLVETPHASMGWLYAPEYWNHNRRDARMTVFEARDILAGRK